MKFNTYLEESEVDIVLILLWYVAGVVSSWMFDYFTKGQITRGEFVIAFLLGVLGIGITLICTLVAIAIWADKNDQPFIVRKKK